MAIEYDSNKDKANIKAHGISLAAAERMFDGPTVEDRDDRHQDEIRIIAVGMIGVRVYVCVYTWRGRNRRIISLRHATKRESNDYYQTIGQGG